MAGTYGPVEILFFRERDYNRVQPEGDTPGIPELQQNGIFNTRTQAAFNYTNSGCRSL